MMRSWPALGRSTKKIPSSQMLVSAPNRETSIQTSPSGQFLITSILPSCRLRLSSLLFPPHQTVHISHTCMLNVPQTQYCLLKSGVKRCCQLLRLNSVGLLLIDLVVQITYCSGVPRNFVRGGGFNKLSWGQREWGSGGGSPLARGSGSSCNLVQEISFQIVTFS